MADDIYQKLVTLLDERGATYRVIEHDPEGETAAVSALRGHDPAQAAKCIIIMVKVGKKVTKFVAAVLPGDKRVSFDKLKGLTGGTFARFAERHAAEELAGTPVGTIPPFAFDERLELIFDPELVRYEEIFFNAGRLDRTIGLATKDYLSIAEPRIASLTEA
ncbi:YbaK/EbsC family protein [Micromonospora sp. RTGN7]|uniref:YbaK/EbsC family protein n=1 Tax=Micromonospora sp. RTGN7 TaxID=3016526 RepID=UPI0029FECB5D|nr:YbaK/EbsC family protein [Micromonospora sp. RTGN7]